MRGFPATRSRYLIHERARGDANAVFQIADRWTRKAETGQSLSITNRCGLGPQWLPR